MATLGELTRQHTSLTRDEIDHLQRLIGEWGLLADLSFADLLLYVPDNDGKWIVIAHVRPATGQTIYAIDYVGTAAEVELPLLDKSYRSGEICEGEIEVESVPEPVRMMATPVRCNDKGGYDPKGKMWRVGWSILTGAELLERAERTKARAA